MSRILFVGTRDKFRSKFACLYFNELCREKNLPARGISAGFSISKDFKNIKKDNHALDFLGVLGFLIEEDDLRPTELTEVYLNAADRVICMNMDEHITMMRKKFPEQVNKSTYWHYSDEFAQSPWATLALIQKEVDGLMAGMEVIA